MRQREPILVGVLFTILFLVWLGFPFHASPRFPGSLWGGMLAIAGSGLMLIPLVYSIVKRNKRIKASVTRYAPMRRVLAWHIYAGILGPILILLHTGHNYQSPLGIALTALMLIVVLSGFIGRFLIARISRTIKTRQTMLKSLYKAYEDSVSKLREHPDAATYARPFTGIVTRSVLRAVTRPDTTGDDLPSRVAHTIELAESIADLEYANRTHETFRRAFRVWLQTHIILSMSLYVLLTLHVWSAIHFGLRWFA